MNDEDHHREYQSRNYPVQENMEYQIKVWRFERWGWYALVLVVLFGLLGLFSRGPLSAREVHGSDGKISAQYELFHRNGSSNPMKISVVDKPDTLVKLELSGAMLDGFSIESLQPEPVRASSGGSGMTLWMQTDGQGRASLYLTLRADGLGLFSTRLASPGAKAVDLDQFILP